MSRADNFLSSVEEAVQKRYKQIEVRDLVKLAGGPSAIKHKFDNSDDAYKFLIQKQKELTAELLKEYKEVGIVDPTALGDTLDDLLPRKDYTSIIKNSHQFHEIKTLVDEANAMPTDRDPRFKELRKEIQSSISRVLEKEANVHHHEASDIAIGITNDFLGIQW